MPQDPATPVTDSTQLRQGLEEMVGLRGALRDAIERATAERSQVDGHPVHPDLLCSLLMAEVGIVVIKWGHARRLRPEEIEREFEELCRRARRGLTVQLQQIFLQASRT
jgi:hypothetical protein